jgi:hypothetical protein
MQTFVSALFIYLDAWDSLPVWWCPQMNKPCSLCTINADILKACDDMVEIDGQMWHDAVAVSANCDVFHVCNRIHHTV